jgi:hypothetical protein
MLVKSSTFNVICKKPTEQEYQALSQINLTKETVAAAAKADNKSNLKAAVLSIVIAIISVAIAVIYVLIINLEIELFRVGTTSFSLNPLLILIPSGFALVFFGFAIIFLKKGVSTSLQKTPESLLKKFFLEYPYEYYSSELALTELSKMMPKEVLESQNLTKTNIEKFICIMQEDRKNIVSEIENAYIKATRKKNDSLMESAFGSSEVVIHNTKELYKGIFEINATISKTEKWINSNKGAVMDTSYNFASYTLRLNINCVLIQSGAYWFAYDLISEIEQANL